MTFCARLYDYYETQNLKHFAIGHEQQIRRIKGPRACDPQKMIGQGQNFRCTTWSM